MTLLALCLLAPALAVAGDCVVRQRVLYSSAGYGQAYGYVQKEYVPHLIEVEVHRDRYYSLSELYRDRLLLDLYERLLEKKPGSAESKATSDTSVEARTVLDASCIRCHKAGPLDLTKPDTVPEALRWKAYALANAGEMPPNGEPVKDAQVKSLYEWAKAAGAKAKK